MRPKYPEITRARKIAVLRSNALGDFIVSLPAFAAIRAAYPGSEIVLLGQHWQKDYLRGQRTVIDRVITIPPLKGVSDEESTDENGLAPEAFFKRMEKEEFDIAVSFQGSGISCNPFIRRLGAKLSVGFYTEGAVRLDKGLYYDYYQSEMMRYLELVKMIGAMPVTREATVRVLPADLAELDKYRDCLKAKAYIILHPFARDIRRIWPLENYIPLADKLVESGWQVAITGSAEQREAINDLVHQMKYPEAVWNTAGDFSLGGLTAFIARAACMVAPDTGPLHLAQALEVPTVGLYWAPNLINWGPLDRAIHRPVVSWDLACPLCGVVPNDPYPFEPKDQCPHLVSFVRDISVQDILNRIYALFPVRAVHAQF